MDNLNTQEIKTLLQNIKKTDCTPYQLEIANNLREIINISEKMNYDQILNLANVIIHNYGEIKSHGNAENTFTFLEVNPPKSMRSQIKMLKDFVKEKQSEDISKKITEVVSEK